MILNHTEKEFISAITTYEGKAKSLAEVLNKSKLLERREVLASYNMEERILFF